MRIAMISEHASPLAVLGGEDAGGQNTHVAELSAALAAAGHDVRVYTRRDAVDLPVTVRAPDGYEVVHVPAGPAEPMAKDALLPHMPAFGRWLAQRWRGGDWTPEVIHAHFWMSGLAGLAAGRRTGVPVVQTYHALGTVKRRHQGAQDTSPPGRIRDERDLGRAVDRVVAQCQDEVTELVRLGVPRGRISVVPSGVNLATFAPLGPAVGRDPGRARVLTVGRLVERKGFQDVIRAMPLVPDAECVVVGGPPEGLLETDPHARRLRALARECGVADRVRLVGAVPREEMGRWYRSADVLVAAPWYEPFGLTPLEAMACGVPVVGTAVGGLTDTVLDGVTGDLVPARDPRALGTAIRGLLDDRIRRFAYAGAARDRARRSYSWAATAQRLAEVYGEVAAVRRPTRVVA
ncbi:glycosyltransferase [Micromonospora carbonacea]|uniref:Glycosyltransferase involved in cell wall bisynthesis n=1 Tax=Micromonospora carbonacea TaxID=47853 RepID=A0A1C4ZIY6_9ACTN|nr:glycosyltransferase [Micromonospora carbonacea]SCF32806.1 Glycosyltransferase involved in cell wall bisynthesis [Micromonospora carbonacea]